MGWEFGWQKPRKINKYFGERVLLMYLPFRYSKNIEKQILWYFLAFLFLSKKFNSVLDVGCGYGQNIRFLRFNFYLGLDIDKKRISVNNKKFNSNNIKFLQHDIIESKFISSENYDLILLIQVMTNSLFSKKEVTIALQNLMDITKKRFIFNTSSKNKKEIEKIDYMLKKSQLKFKKINYGVPSFIRKIKIPILTQVISFLYLILIFLDNKVLTNEKIIYICEIK